MKKKKTKMENINKHSYECLRDSAMRSRMRKLGKFWFSESIEILKLCDYKVKIIKGIENNKLKYAITPEKIAPDLWLFACDTRKKAIEFIEKMGLILIKK